jgi:hypothetical protein
MICYAAIEQNESSKQYSTAMGQSKHVLQIRWGWLFDNFIHESYLMIW